MKKKRLRTAAGLLAAVLLLPLDVSAVSAKSYIVMDAQTGRVLQEHRADERSLIASTTKIMTALVICEQCNVLDRVRIPKEAVGIEGSSMYLQQGEILTVQDLLYGLMLHSGNDAAVALAIYCGGTVEGFAELMNDKARVLGLSGTHFMNPNGLDHPQHYSTARDLAVLSAYAMENPVFARTVSTKSVTIGSRSLKNHNKLLWLFEGADGVKTGFTRAAGRILVSSATREGRRLIAVTINDRNDWQDHMQMLEAGFGNFKVRQLVSAGEQIGTMPVLGGAEKEVPLLADQDFFYAMADGEEIELVLPSPGFVYAPITQGAEAGFAYLCIDGNAIGKIPLVYGQTVEMELETKRNFWDVIFGGKEI